MFDKKKLEAFLKSLDVEKHYSSVAPAPPRSELDKAMDKYDLFKQGNYEKRRFPPKTPSSKASRFRVPL
jgi:hypothetical protein